VHRALAVLLGCVALAGACSGGGGEEHLTAPSSTVKTGTTAAPSSPGKGSLVLGGFPYEFAVERCQATPATDEPEAARTLFRLEGTGRTFQDEPFTVTVLRFQTQRDATTTVTDTVDVRITGDRPRQSQAQRVEVAGATTDLRDPAASGPLLRISGPRVQAEGTFGPADATAKTTVEGTLDAMCPGGGS
jgi:hypothetical protein